MWVESVIQIGDQHIGLSVQRLDDDERERTAAVLAWLALGAMRSGTTEEATAWNQFVNDVLRENVTFSVPHEDLDQLGRTWWGEAVGRALLQFVRQNELAPRIDHHLQTLQATDCSDQLES